MNESSRESQLFEPIRVGALDLANRVVMAPLTRSRAGAGDAVGALNAEHYAQRASAGLIVSEATFVSPQAKGYMLTPGIYTDEQVSGWKEVTDAVHAKGGKIVAQLWHVGRISHPSLQPEGALPVAPSALKAEGQVFTASGFQPLVTPRALDRDEIAVIVEEFRHATECARRAGFDGVEIHGANAYLIEQFLTDAANQRTDEYGGSIENRARFALEVARAVAGAWSADRVGFRVSPASSNPDIADSDPEPLYLYLARELSDLGLAYLHVVENPAPVRPNGDHSFDFVALRRAFSGAYIANRGYDRASAEAAFAEDRADLVSFGRPFVANPDLVERMRESAPLAQLDPATLYGGDARGYVDYPPMPGARSAGSAQRGASVVHQRTAA